MSGHSHHLDLRTALPVVSFLYVNKLLIIYCTSGVVDMSEEDLVSNQMTQFVLVTVFMF